MIKKIYEYLKEVILVVILFLSIGVTIITVIILQRLSVYNPNFNQVDPNIEMTVNTLDEQINTNDNQKKVCIDIKGAVKKIGVYCLDEHSIINDVINLAGGFKSNAFKDNINLSKKVKDEMLIFVYTKSEYNKLAPKEVTITQECKGNSEKKITECLNEGYSVVINDSSEKSVVTDDLPIDSNSLESINDKVNINTASKEELMTLSGVGESKAINIINYRELNGEFKKIEDIMNVSGIGNSVYEKIKNNITV